MRTTYPHTPTHPPVHPHTESSNDPLEFAETELDRAVENTHAERCE